MNEKLTSLAQLRMAAEKSKELVPPGSQQTFGAVRSKIARTMPRHTTNRKNFFRKSFPIRIHLLSNPIREEIGGEGRTGADGHVLRGLLC